jgi:hypothetical protein
LNVSIPGNTQATIYIPSKENAFITESGNTVHANRYEKGYAIVEVGSGDYSFKAGY